MHAVNPAPVGSYVIRKATAADTAALSGVIAKSARGLSAGYYESEEVEAALRGAFGVDSQLVDDGTYFVATEADEIVACGGWSRRRTLFGGDAFSVRDSTQLDPATDAARIRAFFVLPSHARRGIGKAILHRCESEAAAMGFSRFALMATLPGVDFYTALGYVADEPLLYDLGHGRTIRFVPMHKVTSP
ncbi:MAG TPA: GNAT family N-acetyltransferase [Steroidobacteraceae bacterium]|nr:GNAT family N-acetyltransferase [Steroidobacteraceae bacterium]